MEKDTHASFSPRRLRGKNNFEPMTECMCDHFQQHEHHEKSTPKALGRDGTVADAELGAVLVLRIRGNDGSNTIGAFPHSKLIGAVFEWFADLLLVPTSILQRSL